MKVLPENRVRKWMSLATAVLVLMGALWKIGGPVLSWAGSAVVLRGEFTQHEQKVAEAIDKITISIACSDYRQTSSSIRTQETIQTNAKSQIEAMRVSGVKLTSIELGRYNDILLDLDRLKEARQKLVKPRGCE